jgi:glycine/D-amino acid oxidase-like deaminating enzyme
MLTRKRDLKSGVSLWQKDGTPRIKTDRLEKSAAADVAVIGAGISGALVADALLNSGLSVIAVDRRKPVSGSTSASTALLEFELDTPLTILARKIGKESAARAWIKSAAAVQALADRIHDLGIDCDFRERPSLYLPGNVLDARQLRVEAEERKRLCLRSRFLGRGELRRAASISAPGAILSHGNAEADPIKLAAGLWRNYRKNGGVLISPFDAADLDESKTRINIRSADGRRITAKHAVLCTGYEVPKSLKLSGLRVTSTWAFATKPQPRRLWPGQYLVWQAAAPYLYMRTTRDGRVVAGGADEAVADTTKRDGLIEAKTARIARLAKRIFPAVDFQVDCAWTGNFGESETGLPVIGLVPGYRRCHAVMGFGGNGFTFSMLAAQLICREINGVKDADAGLFQP